MTSFNLVSLLSYLEKSITTPFFFPVLNHKNMKYLLHKADPFTCFINSTSLTFLSLIISSPMILYFSLVSKIALTWAQISLFHLFHFPPLSTSPKISLFLLFPFLILLLSTLCHLVSALPLHQICFKSIDYYLLLIQYSQHFLSCYHTGPSAILDLVNHFLFKAFNLGSLYWTPVAFLLFFKYLSASSLAWSLLPWNTLNTGFSHYSMIKQLLFGSWVTSSLWMHEIVTVVIIIMTNIYRAPYAKYCSHYFYM